ncbi:hypothetical protein [Deefgea sp. CFH1-16]|uniref:hypothetical protein n=1 Tax=Deefgea sp. CFH1-16 TaxID=2675457 RepID=UPI0015F391B4|nr:hypothetical protein [Deefgea sp. CFH1-16]MBM5573661.1 hypothetical protein [Deefgea sp. CFH1-16]
MSTTNIEERLIVVLKAEAQAHGFWSKLESETGVSAQRWRKVVSERQRPTCDMIEAAAKRWPQFSLWLTTGIAYAEIGQIRPPADEYRRTPKQKNRGPLNF